MSCFIRFSWSICAYFPQLSFENFQLSLVIADKFNLLFLLVQQISQLPYLCVLRALCSSSFTIKVATFPFHCSVHTTVVQLWYLFSIPSVWHKACHNWKPKEAKKKKKRRRRREGKSKQDPESHRTWKSKAIHVAELGLKAHCILQVLNDVHSLTLLSDLHS